MKRFSRPWLGAVTLLLLALGSLVVLRGPEARTTAASAPAGAASKPQRLPPAANLRIPVVRVREKAEVFLDMDARAWSQAQPAAVLLNRTPRIYQTEPATDRPPPACRVGAVRSGDKLCLRLRWDDATQDAPQAPSARADAPKHLPKRPTARTSAFADAAAVMVPKGSDGPAFPSLQMGDKNHPVRLYYWNAARGAEELAAAGRATPLPAGRKFPCRARHDGSRWTLTMVLPDPGDGCPVAFAVWDGHAGDRDGLKFFSVWYVLGSP